MSDGCAIRCPASRNDFVNIPTPENNSKPQTSSQGPCAKYSRYASGIGPGGGNGILRLGKSAGLKCLETQIKASSKNPNTVCPKHALMIPLSLKEDDLPFKKAPTQTEESQKNIILRETPLRTHSRRISRRNARASCRLMCASFLDV